MYAKLKSVQVLGKTLDSLNVSVVNYALGTSTPTLGYSILDADREVITQGTLKLDVETYNNWTTDDEVILHYVAEKLNVEILEVHRVTKTSAEYLAEDPTLETR